MAVREPRNRLVIFRVTEAEFQRLLAACRRNHARSLSDFVRVAALSRTGARSEAALAAGVARLGARIRRLEACVLRLLERLEQGKGK